LFNIPIEVSTEYNLSEVEVMVFRILDMNISRLEYVVMKLEMETEMIDLELTSASHAERVKFIRRLKKAR
jgi:hypothetical protein